MTDDEPPVWRTAEEIAGMFGVQVRTVWAWRRRGHIAAVDGRYDLRQVLHWWDHSRDTRRAEIRQRVARPSHPRVYLDRQQPHAQSLSGPAGTIGAVDFGPSFLANGTAASFASPGELLERPAQPWDQLIDSELPAALKVRVATRCHYLRRIGIDIDRDLIDRVTRVEQQDAAQRDRQPIMAPTTVYYLRVGSLIKIGQSVDVASRLRAYPPGTVLLATEVGERDELEAERLAQFNADRAHRREWFHPSAALIGHINSLRERPLTPAELAS